MCHDQLSQHDVLQSHGVRHKGRIAHNLSEYACPLGTVMVGQWTYPIGHAKEAIVTLDGLARSRPREFSVAFTPTSSSLSVTAVWVGDIAHTERMLGPFGRLAPEGQGSIAHVPFVKLQSCNDDHFAWSRRYYAKGGFWRSIARRASCAGSTDPIVGLARER
jgi:hypothetical protein